MSFATWNEAVTAARDRADRTKQVNGLILPEESYMYMQDHDHVDAVEPLLYSLHLLFSDVLVPIAIVVCLSSPIVPNHCVMQITFMYMYSTGALFPRIQSLSNDDSNSNTTKQKV